MPNPEYPRLLRCDANELRSRLPGGGDSAGEIGDVIADLTDEAVIDAISTLGGHDLDALRSAYQEIDDTRPTVIIAYTIEGYGLPMQGHPQNHSSLLTPEQFCDLAATLGKDPMQPWGRFDPASRAGRLCRATAAHLHRVPPALVPAPVVPSDIGRIPPAVSTTQAALGRTLLDLTREAPAVSHRIVTVSPDVSSTTTSAGGSIRSGYGHPTSVATGLTTTARRSCAGARSPRVNICNSVSLRPIWWG
jgi:pyruvate dehydrogenase E1 component